MKAKGLLEKIILASSVIGITATASYLIYNKPSLKRVDKTNQGIGYVRPIGTDVRVKGDADLNWNNINKDSTVFQQDKVYTGAKSTAVVNLKSQQKLLVQPNSLIVIVDDTNEVKINLQERGSFFSELKKGVKLIVKRDKTETQIESDGATIQLESHNDNEIKLVVLKGEVGLKTSDEKEPVIVSANTEVKINEAVIDSKPLKIELVTPLAGAALWASSENIKLDWATLNNEKNSGTFFVDISTDPLFSEKETFQANDQSLSVKLNAGSVYFWRVRAKDSEDKNQEIISATSSFSYFDRSRSLAEDHSETQATMLADLSAVHVEVAENKEPIADNSTLAELSTEVVAEKVVEAPPVIEPQPPLVEEPAKVHKKTVVKTPAPVIHHDTDEHLTPQEDKSAQSYPPFVESQDKEAQKRKISSALGIDEWNISVLYGAKYLSISQSENLGKANVGALFINDIKVNSEFLFDDWSLGFQVDTYKFKYESLTKGDSKQMSSFNLYGSYKWLMAGLNIEETPLFRNNGGSIEMTKNSLIYLSVGAKKDIELPTRKPTAIKLKGWVSYPVSSSSDKAEVELSSVSGFTVNGQAELNREIFAKPEYALYTVWQTGVGYRSLEQKVEWDVSKGKVKSQILDLSTALGLLFKF